MSLLGNLTVGILGNMTGLSGSLNGAKSEVQRFGKSMESVGRDVSSMGSSLTKLVTVPLAALSGAALKVAMDFETSFTNVRKYMTGTESEFAKMRQSIRDLAKDTPFTTKEISNVAAAAAQLGIENKNIMSFSKAMLDIGVSSNLASNDAAVALARFANITQMPQENFERLGSTVVALGNNFAAMESEIVEMGGRLAGAGATINMTEAQILGMSTALTALGINAEAGGSAFSKLMVNMASEVATSGDKLEGFAKVAGMTATDFQKAFKEDAAGAITLFLEGLGKMKDNGENVFGVIEDLGLSEIRLRDALLRAAGAGDLFRKSLEVGTKAWEENTELAKTSGEFYDTTANKAKALMNRIADIGITIGDALIPAFLHAMDVFDPMIKILEQAANWFSQLDPAIQAATIAVGAIAAAIGPFLVVLGMVISSVGTIITAFGSLGGVMGILTGPIGLTVAALAGITAGGAAIYNQFKGETIPEIDRFGDTVSESTKKALGSYLELSDGASQKLSELSITQKRLTTETKDELVGTYGQMTQGILTKMDERQSLEMQKLQTILDNSTTLTTKEKEDMLERTEQYNERQAKVVELHEQAIKEILQKAADEKRELSEKEIQEIDRRHKQMNETAVKYLSQNEVESKVILEKMKQQAEDLTARQAAEVVKNSLKQKEESVKAAEDQYADSIAEIIKMRDESKVISADQAQRMIADVTRQKDQTVKAVEEQHDKVVSEAKKQAKGHVDSVDWETGEVLSKWEMFQKNASKAWDAIKEKISTVLETFSPLFETIKEAFQNLIESVEPIWESLKSLFESLLPILQTIALVVGTVLVTALGLAVGVLNATVSALGPVIDGFVKFADFIVNTVLAVVYLFTGEWDKALEHWNTAVKSSVETIKKLWNGVINFISTLVKTIIDFFVNLYMTLVGNSIIPDLVNEITDWFKNMFKWVVDIVKEIVTTVIKWFTDLKEKATPIFEALKTVIATIWEAIKVVFNTVVSFIVDFVLKNFTNIKDSIQTTLEAAKTIITTVWNFIKSTFQNVLSFLKSLVKGDFKGMRDAINSQMENARQLITTIWNAIKNFFSSILGNIIKTVSTKFLDMVNSVKERMNKVKSTIETIWNQAQGFLKNVNLLKIGKDIIQGLVKGIGAMKEKVTSKVKEIASLVPKTLTNFLDIRSPSRVTTKIGEDTGEGFVQGISKKQKAAEKAAKKAAQAAAKNFKEALDAEKYRFKMGEIDAAEHIKSLEKVRDNYAKTPEQIRKINLEIKKIEENSVKELEKLRKEAAKREAEERKKSLEASKIWIEERKKTNELSLIEELAAWERVQARFEEGTKERIEADKQVLASKKAINDQMISINEEYVKKVEEVNSKLIEDEKKLNEEYEKALESRTGSLYNFAGIFDELKERSDVSGEQLMENLRGQIVVFAEWAENIERLAEKGIDEGLLDELRAMGPKAAAEVAALNSLTDSQLQEYAGLWKTKNELARKQATKELEGLRKETDQKISELHKNSASQLEKLRLEWDSKIKQIRTGTTNEFTAMNASMQSIGNDTIKGLMDGIREMEGPLMQQAKAIADSVASTMRRALDIKSPSRVMKKIGGFVGEGLALGMDDAVSLIEKTAKTLAEAAVPSVPSIDAYSLVGMAGNRGSTVLPTSLNLLAKDGDGGSILGGITQNLTINSPTPLSPYETARMVKRGSQQLAMERG